MPDDVQGPKMVQQEDDPNGKCLAKTYHSDLRKKIFPPNDFLSPDGKDSDPGRVTVNLYPDSNINVSGQYENGSDGGVNHIFSTSQM